jgi:plastocyanin
VEVNCFINGTFKNISMKKTLLTVATIAMTAGALYATQHTITNSGYTFTPDYIEINPGDTVNFNLGSIHNAIEVSEATWNANGNTSDGGFSLPLGGGTITLNTIGMHYYVCGPHASLGMKGRINVVSPNDLLSAINDIEKVTVFPNPASDFFTLEYSLNAAGPVSIKLIDITGREIAEILQAKQEEGYHQVTYSVNKVMNPGLYLIDILQGDRSSVHKLIIQ